MSITLELPGMTPERVVEPEVITEEAVINEVNMALAQLENLPPEDKQQVEAFAKQIDLHSSEIILCYGEPAQRKLETFTDKALQGVTGRDVGEIGKLLSNMSVSIKNFNDKTDSRIVNFFRSLEKKAEELRVQYDETANTLERIKKELLGQRTTLLVDIRMLDEMYEQNLEYYKELTMYILAGNRRLEEVRNGELEELRRKAETTGAQEDAFRYSDLKDHCENFEQQVHDLELTRAICLQTAPQIRLVQKTNEQLARKIQSSINNTIPIWKQKISIALAIEHNARAGEVQKELTDLTSQMLMENAKKLHTSVVAAAKESERGIIDIEAVIFGNNELMDTIDDVLAIHEDGQKARIVASAELMKASEKLKQKLLGVSQQTMS